MKIQKVEKKLIEGAKSKYREKGFVDEEISNKNIEKFYDNLIPEFKEYIKK